jgi:hypothetical protein
MPSNLQDEKIPMAYSRFLDNGNDEHDTTNYPLSNIFRLGNEIYDENKNNPGRNTIKQSIRKENKYFIISKNPSKMPYHLSNQLNFLKMNNSYSDFLAQPLEVYLSENMSSNKRGETIPMVCSCFFEKLWNNHKVYSVYSIQKCRSKYSFGEGNIKRRDKSNWLEKNIM